MWFVAVVGQIQKARRDVEFVRVPPQTTCPKGATTSAERSPYLERSEQIFSSAGAERNPPINAKRPRRPSKCGGVGGIYVQAQEKDKLSIMLLHYINNCCIMTLDGR
jgi:hypothetical protein